MSFDAQPQATLVRTIGRFGFCIIALNGIVGSGIFALPSIAMAFAGYLSSWLFLLSGLLATTIALSIARAASFFRQTGGPVTYATHAFGPFVGFQTGWLMYLSLVAGMAGNANLLISYASLFWPPLESDAGHALGVAVLILLLTWLNVIGVRNSVVVLYVLSILKLTPLFLLIFLGLPYVDENSFFATDGISLGASSLGQTLLILMYAYIGFEASTINAGEAKNPQRDIPYALLLTITTVSIFYFLIQLASSSVHPDLAISKTPISDVAEILLGAKGALLLSAAAVFSIAGTTSIAMLAAPRLTYELANSNSLPKWFGGLHHKYKTPANSVIFCGMLAMLLGVSQTFLWLVTMGTLARILIYIVCISSLHSITKTIPTYDGQFTLVGGRMIPLFALGVCIWLVSSAPFLAWLTICIILIAGSFLWHLSRAKRAPIVRTK